MISLDLEIGYPSEDIARAVMSAVMPENKGYVDTSVEGCKLVLRMSAEKAGTLRNTADDLLACIKAAEDAIGLDSRRSQAFWSSTIATFSIAWSSGDSMPPETPSLFAFSGVTSMRESSLSMPISSRRGSSMPISTAT